MSVVRIVQPHTSDKVARQVEDATHIAGERVLLVRMYTAHRHPDGWPHCEHCWDDVYQQSDTSNGICPYCYGTGWKNGISSLWFTSAIISDVNNSEDFDKTNGSIDLYKTHVQMAAYVAPEVKDWLFRINGWRIGDKGLSPILSAPYSINTQVKTSYFRDGYSYVDGQNVIGYSFDAEEYRQAHPISNVMVRNVDEALVTDKQVFVVYPDQDYDSFKLEKESR
jgi:hypothetical protein